MFIELYIRNKLVNEKANEICEKYGRLRNSPRLVKIIKQDVELQKCFDIVKVSENKLYKVVVREEREEILISKNNSYTDESWSLAMKI